MKNDRHLLKKSACIAVAALMLGGCGQPASGTASEAQSTKTETSGSQNIGTATSEAQSTGTATSEAQSTGRETSGSQIHGSNSSERKDEAQDTTADPMMQDTNSSQNHAESGEKLSAASAEKSTGELAGLYGTIEQEFALRSMVTMPDNFINNYYGIDTGTLEDYIFAMSEDATSAETVIIMRAKDISDTGSLTAALQVVIDEKKAEMENYLPEQFQIVDKSEVKVSGSCVFLVISEQAESINQVIESSIQ